MHRTIGILLIISVAAALVLGVLAPLFSVEVVNALYGLIGLSYGVFGIWGGVLLIKTPQKIEEKK